MTRAAKQVREQSRQTAPVEWIPSSGTRHWLCFNDLEVLLLAQGLTTDRIQQQAQMMAKAIEPET